MRYFKHETRNITLVCVFFLTILFFACLKSAYANDIYFSDPNFELAVRQSINKPVGDSS